MQLTNEWYYFTAALDEATCDKIIALGGDDGIENLRPLHWINNLAKGDLFPHSCEDCALKEY